MVRPPFAYHSREVRLKLAFVFRSCLPLVPPVVILLSRVLAHPLLIDIFGHRMTLWDSVARHPFLVLSLCALGVVTSWAIVRIAKSFDLAELLAFYNRRGMAAALLLAVALWPASMMLDPGDLLKDDWLPQFRAAAVALQSLQQGIIPCFTFLYGNGVTFTFQYPPLTVVTAAVGSHLTGLSLDFALKLTAFSFHFIFVLGLYRLLRSCWISRASSIVAVAAVSMSQQFLASTFLHGALPTLAATALFPGLLYSTHRLVLTGRPVWLAAIGLFMGFIVLAHPVSALFVAGYLGLVVAALCVVQRSLISRLPLFLSGAAIIATMVASPYVLPFIAYRAHNAYIPTSVSQFQFPSVSIVRALQWHPRIGYPPGIGTDNSGYLGIVLVGANILLIAACLMQRRCIPSVRSFCAYCAALTLGMVLVYGSSLPGYALIPYIHLAKGTYRLFVFLAVPLAFGVAALFDAAPPRWRPALTLGGALLVLLESGPFSFRPYFVDTVSADVKRVVDIWSKQPVDAYMLVERGQTEPLAGRLQHELARRGIASFYYVHHEEITVTGAKHWRLYEQLRDLGQTVSSARTALKKDLQQFRVTHVIVVGPSSPFDSELGALTTEMIERVPVQLIRIEGPRTIRRMREAIFEITAEPSRADGSLVLPIGFHPRLESFDNGIALATHRENGFLGICCTGSASRMIRVVFSDPPWLRMCWFLSVSSTLVLVGFFIIVEVRRRRARAHLAGSLPR